MSESNEASSPDSSELSPHPLVLGLAGSLYGGLDAPKALELARKALADRYGVGASTAGRLVGAENDTFVTDFVTASDRAQLILIAGYLADSVDDWHVLFTDEVADSYVLVRSDDIKFFNRVSDPTAAFGLRDVVWVTADAPVLSGDRTQSVTARITTGGFTRAGDFRSSLSGGTLTGSGDQGPLFTALTPCCCRRYSP